MRSHRRLMFIWLALVFLSPAILTAQGDPSVSWSKTNGPYGVNVTGVSRNPEGHVLISSWAGIYRTTNEGTSWSKVGVNTDPTQASTSFSILCLSNGVLIVGPSTLTSVYRSTNGGTSWSPSSGTIDAGGGQGTGIYAFLQFGGYVFAASNGAGVRRSSDHGASWSVASTGLTNLQARALVGIGSRLIVGTLGSGLFVSTNNGASWSASNLGMTALRVRSLHRTGSTLLAGTEAGVFASADSGGHWSKLNVGTSNGLADTNVFAVVGAPDGSGGTDYFAGTIAGGIFRSTDQGVSWNSVNSGLTSPRVQTLVVDTNAAILAGTMRGLFRSTDRGATWTCLTPSVTGTIVWSLKMDPASKAMYAATSSGVYRRPNDGSAWVPVETGINVNAFDIHFLSATHVLATGEESKVARSTNGGVTWELIDIGATASLGSAVCPSGTILVGGWMGMVRRSTNQGATWGASSTGIPTVDIYDIATGPNGSGGTIVYAATWGGGVYRSTDDGLTWSASNAGLNVWTVNAVVTSGTADVFVATDSGVYRSTDRGSAWAKMNTGLPRAATWGLATNPDHGRLFAGNAGVYGLPVPSVEWQSHNANLTNLNVQSLTVDVDGFLWIGTRTDGVFRMTPSTPVAADHATPTVVTLEQNYPNPFNPETQVQFSLASSGIAKLTISDLLGREIAVLVEGERSVGRHVVRWNASGHPSGIYFCRLEAGGMILTRKLVLQK